MVGLGFWAMDTYGGGRTDYPPAPLPPNQPQEHLPDMSIIGAPVAGGGFNQRDGGGLAHAPLKALNDVSESKGELSPVEGTKAEVKYKMEGASVPEAPTAVSKPISSRK